MIVVVKALASEDGGPLELRGVVGSPLMIWFRTEAAFIPMQVAWKAEFLMDSLEIQTVNGSHQTKKLFDKSNVTFIW